MDSKGAAPSDQIDGQDSAASTMELQQVSDDLSELRSEDDSVTAELETLRAAHRTLESEYARMGESLAQMWREKEEALKQNCDLVEAIKDMSGLYDSSLQREGELSREKEEIKRELEDCGEKVEELLKEKSEKSRELSESLGMVKVIQQGMARVIGSMSEEGEEEHHTVVESEAKDGDLRLSLKWVLESVNRVGLKLDEFKEKVKKQKRDLEYSLVSLTEENRDVNSLLRIALVEKEAVERSLNKLKGNNEQKRGAILQIAERGLQRVGFSFGFMAATAANESSPETTAAVAAASNSDSSECEEETVSLVSTVERIVKNLRLEATRLKRSLDESRSEIVRLQSLGELQSRKIEESTMYIKELEDREWISTQNLVAVQRELKEAEKEAARWRHACEMEAQAGKKISQEHEEVISILNQELEKLRAALHASNSKIKIKDELVATAIAAREAAERSLQLADSRAAGLRDRIEELTRQVEDTEKRERTNRRRIRRICWPWRPLIKFNTETGVARNIRQLLPEMQPLIPEPPNL